MVVWRPCWQRRYTPGGVGLRVCAIGSAHPRALPPSSSRCLPRPVLRVQMVCGATMTPGSGSAMIGRRGGEPPRGGGVRRKGSWEPYERHGRLTERTDLPDTVFAFPRQRKEPLTDALHVRNAGARFDQVIDLPTSSGVPAKGAAGKGRVLVLAAAGEVYGKAPHAGRSAVARRISGVMVWSASAVST